MLQEAIFAWNLVLLPPGLELGLSPREQQLLGARAAQ